ncbi:MAG TPA: site-2 protease family protein [Tepidisphaeraceae bacterium]|jgi:Zn-dependent protease|nr:site-2 protease family protein [Tepidisphaeraceae bacterium]
MPTKGFRLFKLFGITVYLHWSWFLVAVYELQQRKGAYHYFGWNVAELLALFAIITMHEFGHALACRSVGGKADRIVLWPLGGVAYVSPPMRPGAMLWSICAGPLVNVILLPVTLPFFWLSPNSDLNIFLQTVAYINAGLLIFNILPIYPLDGGKILWSLLWFPLGMGRALMTASVIGIAGAIGLGVLAAVTSSYWLGLLAAFAVYQAWIGLNTARSIRRREIVPRRAELRCPACGTSPPIGPYWICSTCKTRFDAFDYPDACPGCGKLHQWNTCLSCRAHAPFAAWGVPTRPATVVAPPRGSGVGPI